MNYHLNVFRFFNESPETVFIENNISRAFALCLATDGFFLNEYIKDCLMFIEKILFYWPAINKY